MQRLLIANRGEIAVRIARACRELGIETVAIYSDVDARAPHVTAADRAFHIGPPAPVESYLSIPRVMEAVRASGADAVHPGYGFLAENPQFAAACESAGVVFVGPPADVIERMGSKIESRRLMEQAGIPVVPGEIPDDQSDAGVRRAVDRIGLPAIVKASAGGGGKGMRRIDDAAGIVEAIQSARRESLSAFADGTLYVEKLLTRPRHIEVQVFADALGNVVHLFERDCSIQRRHQKIIEESPSPAVAPALRQKITAAAVQAARACSYRSAGTIEFLVDFSAGSENQFYFLEMNTRLQVEHPVTEQVTGLDLLRAQLLVASGKPLPWAQDGIAQRGHAIEGRIYAEDPAHDFLPQAGQILLYREPKRPGIRVDSGIDEGSNVPVQYDPLLAKVVATAETRDAAVRRLIAALRDFPILGIRTNVPFLLRILEHPALLAGTIDTGFLDTQGGALAETEPPQWPEVVLAAITAHEARAETGHQPPAAGRGNDPWETLRAWRG